LSRVKVRDALAVRSAHHHPAGAEAIKCHC
jgi:hypothetical protein